MHRKLKQLLHEAVGDSRFVVVVFLDVRGFSSFARMAESSESAVFLKSVYTTILDDYFDDASFFKPTGDGLLIVLDYEEENLAEVVNGAVQRSIELVRAFPSMCDSDPMVNFDVPQGLGIGISRGAATRLRSQDMTLDYSGRPLNLASRLMDLARPAGVVFSDTLGPELLAPERAEQFAAESVYIKGLAEDTPMAVRYLAEMTAIRDASKRPINKTRVHEEKAERYSLRQLEGLGNWKMRLNHEPIDRSAIRLLVEHPDPLPSGRKRKNVFGVESHKVPFFEDARGPFIRAALPPIAGKLREAGVRDAWECSIWLEYAVADETPTSET